MTGGWKVVELARRGQLPTFNTVLDQHSSAHAIHTLPHRKQAQETMSDLRLVKQNDMHVCL